MLKTGIRNMAAITAAFLLYGLLRVILYGQDFADLISQLFTGAVILVWGIFVLGRVTDRRRRSTTALHRIRKLCAVTPGTVITFVRWLPPFFSTVLRSFAAESRKRKPGYCHTCFRPPAWPPVWAF